MWLHTRCDMAFDIGVPTPFVLMLRPRSGAQQWIAREEYRLTPYVPVHEFTDGFGNLCQRLVAPPGRFALHTAAEVKTADNVDRAPGAPFIEIQQLPDDVLGYLLPSRYCEADRLGATATQIVAGATPGYDQVAVLENWLRDSIRYLPGSSDQPLSAAEVRARGFGVCRDLAHLGIALCRAISIPARLVVGYLYGLQPMDLHAWFEAYVGGRWYAFDATRQALHGGYVSVGYGRDAADVAVYTQFGPPAYPVLQEIEVSRVDAPQDAIPDGS